MPAKKRQKFVLTRDNYYHPDRPHISNSMVSDFLKSREYFWNRHVLRTIGFESTPSMRIGSMVDDLLCGNPQRFQVKVLKRDDPDRYEEQKLLPEDQLVSEREWNEAIGLYKAFVREPVFAFYGENGARFQEVLHAEHGRVPVCGMADVITETGDTVFIDDFKCVSSTKVSSLSNWYWNCVDFGYLRQLAAYKWMWRETNPGDTRPVVCRHLVGTRLADGLYRVVPIVIGEDLLVAPLREFLEGVRGIAGLLSSKDWRDPPVTWEGAQTLSHPLSAASSEDDVAEAEEIVW